MNMEEDLKLISVVALVLALAALGLVAMIYLTRPADAAEPCLSKTEARAKWPTQHIWWHRGLDGDRCWNDNKLAGGHYIKRKSKKEEEDTRPRPAPPDRADANGNALRTVYVREDEFNELDAQAKPLPEVLYPALMPLADPPLAIMLTPVVLTHWPWLIDVDAPAVFTPWANRAAGAWER